MPSRKTILATGEIYHVLNRSIRGILIFKKQREVSMFLEAAKYYLYSKPPVKFSTYYRNRAEYQLDLSKPLVSIITYCLMPNHFHFILLQNIENGITTYIQRLTNSYSHYFNLKNKQVGPLFEGPFKTVRVKTEEQLLHLSRYLHLNPVTAKLVEHPKDYAYSSYSAYLNQENILPVDNSFVLSYFPSSEEYEKFVLARKNYQRKLEEMKYLLLE